MSDTTVKQRRKERQDQGPFFFKTRNSEVLVAAIGKSGSSAIAKALLRQHFPEKEPVLIGASLEQHPGWQTWVPKIKISAIENQLCVIPVRDPVERFRSAVAQVRRHEEVDSVLDRLLDSEDILNKNFHFRRIDEIQQKKLSNPRFIKWPDDKATLLKLASLEDFGAINVASGTKPDITEQQLERVKTFYSEDIKLFESL